MTIFHLVRHAETDALGRRLTGRTPGTGLNAAGRQSAALFIGRPFAGLLSSPQQRAVETATAIEAACGTELVLEPALDEVDFGDWNGAAFDELAHLPAWAAWNAWRSVAAGGGGETMLQAQARAMGLLQRLHGSAPRGEHVLVSHADIIRAMLAYVFGSPIDLMHRIAVDPASISSICFGECELRVLRMNELGGRL